MNPQLTLFQAIVFGTVQGLGEFLPISSSAHLVLLPWFFNFPDPGLGFDAALHLGTAVALIAFFRKDFAKLLRAFGHTLKTRQAKSHDEKLAWYLLIGSVPAAIIGVLLEKEAEKAFRAPLLIAAALAILGVILLIADRYSRQTKNIKHLNLADALWVGTLQGLAIIPGVSRSGITMTTALFRNFDRTSAARFSFLLSAPITIGAALYASRKLVHHTPDINWLVGIVVSAVVGYLSIKYLLKFLENRSFAVFSFYRFTLAGIVVLTVFLRAR